MTFFMGALPIPAAAFHWAPRMSRAWLEPVRSLLKALVSAVLTTYCKDGRAHNVPVWCHWTGEAFEIAIAKPPCGSCQPCGWSPRRQQHTFTGRVEHHETDVGAEGINSEPFLRVVPSVFPLRRARRASQSCLDYRDEA